MLMIELINLFRLKIRGNNFIQSIIIMNLVQIRYKNSTLMEWFIDWLRLKNRGNKIQIKSQFLKIEYRFKRINK